MRSETVSASSWSWVTKIVLMPSSFWITRISLRRLTRTLASFGPTFGQWLVSSA